MAEVEDAIVDEGAEIIWVLEQNRAGLPGTASNCMADMDVFGSDDQGWCVGDGETEPLVGAFDDSPFSQFRGFDILVAARSMEVVWSSSHGTPAGNENLEGDEVLAAVQEASLLLR